MDDNNMKKLDSKKYIYFIFIFFIFKYAKEESEVT